MSDIILKYRKLIIFVVILLTAASIWKITQLKTESIGLINLPPNDSAFKSNFLISNHFGGMEHVLFVIEAPNILTPEALNTISSLTEEVKYLPGVESAESVLSLATLTKAVPTINKINNKRDGFEIKNLLDKIPETDSEAQKLKQDIDAHAGGKGILVNKDYTASIIIAYVGNRSYPDPITTDSKTVSELYKETERLVREYSKNGVKVSATGNSLIMEFSKNKTTVEMRWITFAAITMLFLVFYFYSGTVLGTLMPLLIVLLSVIWTFGVVSLSGINISPLSIFIIVIIMAVGSSYPIHVITHIRDQLQHIKSKRVAIRAAFYEFSMPLLTVSLTSVLTGISLLIFDIKDIREIGILQSLGITLAFIFSFILVPVLIYIFGNPMSLGSNDAKLKKAFNLSRISEKLITKAVIFISTPSIYWYKTTFFAVVILFALGVYGASKIVANWAPEKDIPTESLPRVGFENLKNNFGHSELINFVAKKTDGSTFYDPSNIKELIEMEKLIKEVPGVKALPSFASVILELQEAMTGRKEIPKTKEQVAQLIFLVGQKKISRLVSDHGKRVLFYIQLNFPHETQTRELKAKLNEIKNKLKNNVSSNIEFAFGGDPLIRVSANQYMVTNKVQSIILCFVIVFLLCTIINSSLKLGFIAVFPSVFAGLITFAIMGYKGIYLDVATSTVTTFAIGVGVDFGVHLLLKFKTNFIDYATTHNITAKATLKEYQGLMIETVRTYGKTIVFDGMSNILALVVLLFSTFPMIKTAGFLLVTNQIIVIACTFFTLPAVLLLIRPNLLTFKKSRIRFLSNYLDEYENRQSKSSPIN